MKMSLKQEFSTVGQFYVIRAIYWLSIGFMAGYWILYYLGLGLDFPQVAFMIMVGAFASVLFEIPTGAVADVYGRRVSVLLSYLLMAISYFGILLSGSNYFLLVLFSALAGISFTLESGAIEAWFVDTVNHSKYSKYLERLLGRWGSVSSFGFAIGAFVGGYLVTFGYDKALMADIIGISLLSLYILFFTTEIYFKKKKSNILKNFKHTFRMSKRGIKFVLNNKQIFLITVLVFFLAFAVQLNYSSYQVHVVDVGFPPQYIGYALSLSGLISIFTLNYAHKISEFLGSKKKTLFLFSLLQGLTILGIAMLTDTSILFFLITICVVSFDLGGRMSPAFGALYNEFVPKKIRATVISVTGLVRQSAEIFAMLAFGLLPGIIGLQYTVAFAGVVLGIAAFGYLLVREK
jgi:MFS family permease